MERMGETGGAPVGGEGGVQEEEGIHSHDPQKKQLEFESEGGGGGGAGKPGDRGIRGCRKRPTLSGKNGTQGSNAGQRGPLQEEKKTRAAERNPRTRDNGSGMFGGWILLNNRQGQSR